jgi:hypothetical protein
MFQNGLAEIPIKAAELLKATGSNVNQNALEASVKVTLAAGKQHGFSTNLAHVLRQKLILFIPGVCGSRITVASHPDQEAYPEPSWAISGDETRDFPKTPINWLRCDKSGFPESKAVRLDLLRTIRVNKPADPGGKGLEGLINTVKSELTVYNTQKWTDLTNGGTHPELYRIRSSGETKSEEREQYYVVKSWPYDWRLRLESAVHLLMGASGRESSDPVWPPYRTPPSLSLIIDKWKETVDFGDDKLAIASHSTGGLITRALLVQPGVEQFVDKAFFIDVPFWGAPKAYYVFFSGDMGLPFIRPRFMQSLSQNMPIVYYLAPTEKYPDFVIMEPARKRYPGQSVFTDFIRQMILGARAIGFFPEGPEAWNHELESSARAFHASIQGTPRIGYQNCIVFYSDTKKFDTQGPLYIKGYNVRVMGIPGDGTVPLVSQIADYKENGGTVIENPAGPYHVPSPNQNLVWEKVLSTLS